jgi:hypothetical protein
VTFHLKVRFERSNKHVDKTLSDNTTYSAFPTNLGHFEDEFPNVYCARNVNENLPPSTVTIYGKYTSGGATVTATSDLKLSVDDEVRYPDPMRGGYPNTLAR